MPAVIQEITGEPRAMWGTSIVGFGAYHYRYASGREGDAPLAGFSPRSQHLVIYLASEFGDRYQAVLARLGPHGAGSQLLYLCERLATWTTMRAARADGPLRSGSTGAWAGPPPRSPAAGSLPVAGAWWRNSGIGMEIRP